MYMFCRCSKELNQWEVLTEYGNAKGNTNSHLVLESAWRQSNYWAVVKDAVSQVKTSRPLQSIVFVPEFNMQRADILMFSSVAILLRRFVPFIFMGYEHLYFTKHGSTTYMKKRKRLN